MPAKSAAVTLRKPASSARPRRHAMVMPRRQVFGFCLVSAR